MVRVRLALLVAVAGPVGAASAQELEFNRDVRPILAENCFACHGPDPSHRKAELRLDTVAQAPEQAAEQVIEYLRGQGLV